MSDIVITDGMIDSLRTELEENLRAGKMSQKRFHHTVEVEKMAARLGGIYAPEKINTLRAAALLHDLTKEYSTDVQLKLCAEYGIELSEIDVYAPKTLHARTGAAVAAVEYVAYVTDEVIGCIRWHTTGRAGMTLCEKLVYLADYIDMSRKFDDCVKLREYFFSPRLDGMTEEEKLCHLDDTLLLSFDMTIEGLIEKQAPISPDTVAARNEIATARLKRKG